MKKIILVVLLAGVFFSGCGWKEINLAKADFIKAAADNLGNSTSGYYNLKRHLIIGNRQTINNIKGGEDITADDIRAWRKINGKLKL